MVNPIHLLNFKPRKTLPRKRRLAELPTEAPAPDAMFVVLRRMRAPFIVVIVTFSFNVAGMMLMPGVDPEGNPRHLTLFDSFYQMAITLTTVGYSEVPYSFSYPQRMWLTLSIFLLVIAWAYAIGTFFSVIGDTAVRDAVSRQRFRGKVRHLREPFWIVLGYGQAGRKVGMELDERQRRFVVLDLDEHRVDAIISDALYADVAAMEGDAANPVALTMAGLGNERCAGVLALTNDDHANLAAVMTVALLRPDVPVITRCVDRQLEARMDDFGPAAVINPHDRYGGYLALALHRPILHQLLIWLMDNDQSELPELRAGLTSGRWLVCGSGEFPEQVVADLRASGIEVIHADGGATPEQLSGAVGFVAGTDQDMVNIAMAEEARIANPDMFVSVRQVDAVHRPLLAAIEVDSIYVPTDLIAREVLARIVYPEFWTFIEEAVQCDDAWAESTRDRLVERVGRKVPEHKLITLDAHEAPAVVRWLADRDLSVGDLCRHPDVREEALPVGVLMLKRGEELVLTPDPDTQLRVGDQLLFAGTPEGLADLFFALSYPATIEYVVTGRVVPNTWLWRVLFERRRARASAA